MTRNSLPIVAKQIIFIASISSRGISLPLVLAMEPHDLKGLHCLPHANSVQSHMTLPPTQKPYPSFTNLSMQPIESANQVLYNASLGENPESSSDCFDRFFSNPLIHVPLHIFSPNNSSLSSETTLHEPRDHQMEIADEKRTRRMISNRESARRSRVRRKKQIEELQCQVSQLQTTNHQLSEKVIHLLESNHQILQENSKLKERVSSLQVALSDMFTSLRNVDENTCIINHLRGETLSG